MARVFRLVFFGRDAAGNTFSWSFSNFGHVDDFNGDVDARLLSAGVLRRALYSTGRVRGELEANLVNIELDNADGALDVLRTYSFDKQQLLIYELDPANPSATPNYPMFSGRMERPIVEGRVVTLSARDMRHNFLKQLPLNKYAGTNSGSPLTGLEGTAEDLKGQVKPFTLGKVFNMSPPLVNTTRQIYQFHGSGSLGSGGYTLTVYDKRSVLTRGADYASEADLLATAPAAGTYRVHTGSGCFRLGSVPVGAVTCDFANPVFLGGASYSNALHRVVEEVARNGLNESVDTFLAATPDCGIHLAEDATVMEALSALLGSVNAFYTYGNEPASGALTSPRGWLGQLGLYGSLPYAPAYLFQLTEGDIPDNSLREFVPEDDDRGLPVWRVNVRYKRNYTVMSPGDLAGVAAADAEFCKNEWRVVNASDASVKTQWPNAPELTVDTLLVNEADAQAEANRLLALHKVRRDYFTLQVHGWSIRAQAVGNSAAFFQPGAFVNIVHSRYGLSAGKNFMVIGIQENLDRDLLDLWVWG